MYSVYVCRCWLGPIHATPHNAYNHVYMYMYMYVYVLGTCKY